MPHTSLVVQQPAEASKTHIATVRRMELTRLRQLAFLILGLATAAVATVLILKAVWVEAVLLILLALFLLTCAVMGAFPALTYKDLSIGFAKVEPASGYLPKDEFEQRRQILADEMTRLEDALRKELKTVSTRLEDYILANGPAPDDGMTDEERLEDWSEGYRDLDQEVSSRQFQGIGYDDGDSTEDLIKARDAGRETFRTELRRQHAQFTFGMRGKPPSSIYDDY